MEEHLRRPESLLHSSAAFRALEEDARRKLATDTVTVTTFLSPQPSPPRAGKMRAGASQTGMRRPLTRPELLPAFVSALVTGTFQAVVDASVQQMQAYAELLASVAVSVEQLRTDPEQQLEVARGLESELRKIFGERDPSAETA